MRRKWPILQLAGGLVLALSVWEVTWGQGTAAGHLEGPAGMAGLREEVEVAIGGVTATVSGRRSYALQPLDRQLTLRGQELIAWRLCNLAPSKNKRLLAAVKGFQVVSAEEADGIRTVTVFAPSQRPNCELQEVKRHEAAPESLPAAPSAGRQSDLPAQPQSLEPTSPTIKVIVNPGEI